MLDRELISKLRGDGQTYSEIGKTLGVSRQRIYQIVTGYRSPSKRPSAEYTDIKLRLISGDFLDTRGINRSFKGREFTREAVRRRDNYTCQSCGKKHVEGKRRLDVHHLNGICGKKSRSYDRVKDHKDLITLCHKCHLNLPETREKMVNAQKGRD